MKVKADGEGGIDGNLMNCQCVAWCVQRGVCVIYVQPVNGKYLLKAQMNENRNRKASDRQSQLLYALHTLFHCNLSLFLSLSRIVALLMPHS